jgi:hypothetical protein
MSIMELTALEDERDEAVAARAVAESEAAQLQNSIASMFSVHLN